MAAIIWTDALSVKINSIDDQHKKLFEIINDFYDNISNQQNQELISRLIAGMKEYTIMHFKTEEKYMREFNYPDFKMHKKEHEDFINKVSELEEKLNNGTTIISFEITFFLKDWIKNHIQESDKKYSSFFMKHGIA